MVNAVEEAKEKENTLQSLATAASLNQNLTSSPTPNQSMLNSANLLAIKNWQNMIGLKIQQEGSSILTSLQRAVLGGTLKEVENLLNNPTTDINSPGGLGMTPLQLAFIYDKVDMFKFLSKQSNINSTLYINFNGNLIQLPCPPRIAEILFPKQSTSTLLQTNTNLPSLKPRNTADRASKVSKPNGNGQSYKFPQYNK